MKKIILSIILFVLVITNVEGSTTEIPVVLTLKDNFYSTITKSVSENVSTFTYKNNLLTMNLTDAQLKSILNQKSGSGSSRLTYYETLNIKVTPVEGTTYNSLKNKTVLYRANDGGAWISDENDYTSDMDTVAVIKNLDDNYWPWGFKIQYRLNTNDAFSSTIPSGMDLSNKTLEEQIATIFNINLENNPNGVVNLYPDKLKFNPLPNRYIYRVRFDFFDKKADTEPVLKAGSTTEYLPTSLNHLGTHYAIIKYDRSEENSTYNEDVNVIPVSNEKNNTKLLIPIIITSAALLSGGIYILFKNGIIKI